MTQFISDDDRAMLQEQADEEWPDAVFLDWASGRRPFDETHPIIASVMGHGGKVLESRVFANHATAGEWARSWGVPVIGNGQAIHERCAI